MTFRAGLVALAALCLCAPAMAQQDDGGLLGQAATCYNFEGKEKPEAVITGCTAVLKRPETLGNDRVDMLFSRGTAYYVLEQLENAMNDYNEAIKLDPKAKEIFFARAVIWQKAERLEESIRDYTAAINLDPKYGDAYGNRGNVYQYGLEDYVSAIKDYDTALGIREHALEFSNRGSAYLYGLQDYPKAIADFDAALKLDATDAGAWGMRCWARTMQGAGLDQAVADCDKAMSLGLDKDPIAVSARAIANYKRKKFQAAWADFDASLKLDASNAEYLYGRGLAAKQLGKAADAQADIAAAVKAEPDVASFFEDYGIRN